GIGPARVRPAVLVVRLRVDDPDPALGDRKERVDPLNAPERRAESKPADLARVPRVGDVEDDRAADAVGQVGTVAHDVRGTVEVVALSFRSDSRRDLLLGPEPMPYLHG